MILVTRSTVRDSICCVCKDGATALDYLRTIYKKPLKAVNFEFGTKQKWRYEGYENFSECEQNPCNWKYILSNTAYFLQPIDYIE